MLPKSDPLDSPVRVYVVTVAEPDIHDPSSDARRFVTALAEQHGLFGVEIGLSVLRGLQKTLRQSQWTVRVAVHMGRSIVAVYSSEPTRLLGVAFDVGTTILCATLVDLETSEILGSESVINPQIRFGADPISRVAHGMTGVDAVEGMTLIIRQCLNDMLGKLVKGEDFSRAHVVDLAFAANPVMHHLLLGIDPCELGGAPFAVAQSEAGYWSARDLGLEAAPGSLIYGIPLIGGHVGSDLASAAIALGQESPEEGTLVIDIGTTVEVLLSNAGQVVAAAPPSGTVLEGLQIEAGCHAGPGAIRELRIDKNTFEPRYRVVGCELWSDDPGFHTAVDMADVPGLCRSGLIDALAELRLSGIIGRDGTINSDVAAKTPRIREEYRSFTYLIHETQPRIAMTQHDIRALQLAKAGVQAAIRILMKQIDVSTLKRVYLSGSPGCLIDPMMAAVVGLFPDCDLENVISVENASLTGALMILLSKSKRYAVEGLTRKARAVETVLDPDFQMEHIHAMGLPNSTLAYPLLGQHVMITDNTLATPSRRNLRRERRTDGAAGSIN